jgi:2-methylcitrate dehydratase PrpD
MERRLFLSSALATGGALVASGALAQAGTQRQVTPQTSTILARPQGSTDAIDDLVQYMVGTSAGALPDRALATTRSQLLDALGVGLGGGHEDGVRQLREIATEVGGKRESVVWGTALRLPAHDAARINAAMVHALEFDDTFGPGFLHPSAITFPAALAVADLVGGVSGKEFLAACTLAIDVACRIAVSGEPGVDGFATGWHNTTLVGYISSALLAARLMALDRDQTINAAGLAYHQAAGNAQAHIDGALAKRLGPGFASAAGIMAARLAARGVTGARNVLEGEKGWYRQYHRGLYSRELLLGGLGTVFAAEEVSYKPWPSCRGSHTSVDAALHIVAAHGLRAENIERVVLRNGPAEYPFLSTPIDRKRRPRTTVEAQFSIPWIVAAALVDRKVSIAQFKPEALDRPDIKRMVDRITPVLDDSLANPAGGPGQAQIDVTTSDGRVFSKRVVTAKGGLEAPMTDTEVEAKFHDCVEYGGLPNAQAVEIRALALDVAALDDVSRLTKSMSVSA